MEKKNSKTYWLVFIGVALLIAIIIFCVWLPIRNKTKAPDDNLSEPRGEILDSNKL